MRVLQVNAETTMLTSTVPVPGIGVLPINAFLIKGAEPVLVDTGIFPESDQFVEEIGKLIDPGDIRWIWLTHADRDHTGSLLRLLELAPNARVATQFLTLGLMGAGCEPIDPSRAHLVRDGSTLELADRTLKAFRPPLFDNPGTLGFLDTKQQIAFCSDCFGAALPTEADALAEDVDAVTEDELTGGQLLWGGVDSPWVQWVDEAKFAASLEAFATLKPSGVLGTHLPPIRGDIGRHLKTAQMLPGAPPFAAPDQAALEALLAQMEGGPGGL